MPNKQDKPKPQAKRGPKPQRLKIKGNWEQAVTKSFQKKKPLGGWPK